MSNMNKRDLLLILNRLKLKPNKKLGQNFLINDNIIKKIITISNILKEDIILEIGPGLGALTESLIKKAKKVYAVEIDKRLSLYLEEKFSNYNNLEIINDNILKIDIPFHTKVVSNIPYTITGPIFEKIFYNEKPSPAIIMIEKKIADRIFNQGEYSTISRITMSFKAFMEPLKKYDISRNCFFPTPKIPISLVKLNPRKEINQFLLKKENREFFLSFLAFIMPYKNKNLLNALKLYIKNKNIKNFNEKDILQNFNFNNILKKKVFTLNINEMIDICKIIAKKTRKE